MTAAPQVRLARAVDVAAPCCDNLAIVTPRPETMHAAELRCAGCGRFRGWLTREAMSFLEEITHRFGALSIPIKLSDKQIGDHSMFKQRENSGALFKNDRRQSENSPDYQGTINIGGAEYQ